jgi:hypothetical protein
MARPVRCRPLGCQLDPPAVGPDLDSDLGSVRATDGLRYRGAAPPVVCIDLPMV